MSSWKAGSACRKNIWWTTGECRTVPFTLDADTRVLTYVEYDGEGDREVYSEQIYYPAISGQNFPGPNPDGENIEYCKISFTVDNSVVTGYNFNGDDCAGKLLPGGSN